MDIESLINKSKEKGEDVWVSGGVDEFSIKTLEEEVGFNFPESYRNFLRTYGALYAMDNGLSGITQADPLEMGGGNLYADTIFMREDYAEQYDVPDYLWVLEKHGHGAYCFNTNIKLDNGEYGIVNYALFLSKESHSETIATSFPEFLEKWYFGYIEHLD
ncbi:SMI1/KNR4 family protein [Marinagarivorans algicola]|uniref:SMI1/KNR4 family protein n=1 Tax=Marinagarivorans algicola TaxID=1513270 RepID=UPI0006B4D803|nr:SMI1/KNR4 family protein [Marinagarivorans algicola]